VGRARFAARSFQEAVATRTMGKLKLFALDTEDLQIVSAHLQDAVARVGDFAWLPAEKRFALILNRFDWTEGAARDKTHHRRRTALHFERVGSVRRRGIRQDNPDAVLNLLAIRFKETDSPAGEIELVFSGGAVIRLSVECLEARLSDLGPAWSTKSVPGHDSAPEPAPEPAGKSSGAPGEDS
jgi:Protein of unknown function (DUF2948)